MEKPKRPGPEDVEPEEGVCAAAAGVFDGDEAGVTEVEDGVEAGDEGAAFGVKSEPGPGFCVDGLAELMGRTVSGVLPEFAVVGLIGVNRFWLSSPAASTISMAPLLELRTGMNRSPVSPRFCGQSVLPLRARTPAARSMMSLL